MDKVDLEREEARVGRSEGGLTWYALCVVLYPVVAVRRMNGNYRPI